MKTSTYLLFSSSNTLSFMQKPSTRSSCWLCCMGTLRRLQFNCRRFPFYSLCQTLCQTLLAFTSQTIPCHLVPHLHCLPSVISVHKVGFLLPPVISFTPLYCQTPVWLVTPCLIFGAAKLPLPVLAASAQYLAHLGHQKHRNSVLQRLEIGGGRVLSG